jgi:hypothetical protein
MSTLGHSITTAFDKNLEEAFGIGKKLYEAQGKLANGSNKWNAPWYAFWTSPLTCCLALCGEFSFDF